MAKNKIKLGVVGTGRSFKKHLVGIVDNQENFEIVGLANHNHKVDLEIPPEWNTKTYYDQNEMFDSLGDELDLVVVLTQSPSHYEISKEVIERGYDLLVEKPFALDSSKVKEISELAKEKNVNAYIVLQCRYMSIFNIAKEVLRENLLGDIRTVDLAQKWQRPIGYMQAKKAFPPLYEYSIHYLDLIQNLFEVDKVIGTQGYKYKHKEAQYNDTVRSVVEYEGGISGLIDITLAAEPSNLETCINILGSEGYIKLDFINNSLRGAFLKEESNERFIELSKKVKEDNLFSSLYNSLILGEAPTLESAIPVTKFIENIYEKQS